MRLVSSPGEGLVKVFGKFLFRCLGALVLVPVFSLQSFAAVDDYRREHSYSVEQNLAVIIVPAIRAAAIADRCPSLDYNLDRMKQDLKTARVKSHMSSQELHYYIAVFHRNAMTKDGVSFFTAAGLDDVDDQEGFCRFGHAQLDQNTAISRYLKRQ